MSTITRNKPATTVMAIAAFALLTAAVTVSQRAITDLRSQWPKEADTLFMPGATALKVMSLGHNEAMADLVAARALVYFGDQISTKGEHRWLNHYLQAATDLDPYLRSIYLRGAVILKYQQSELTGQWVQQSIDLLEKGLQYFPDDWQFHYDLGYNLYYELPPLLARDDPRIAKLKERGTEHLRRATLSGQTPPWLPTLVSRMLTEQGAQEMAIRHLEQAYSTTDDDKTREQIRLKLILLKRSQLAERLERSEKAFAHFQQTAYPYAPDAFSLLVGARRTAGVNLTELLRAPETFTAVLQFDEDLMRNPSQDPQVDSSSVAE